MAADKKQPPQKPNTSTWADRVKVTDSSTRFTLDSIPRHEGDDKPKLTVEMLTENAEQWDRCMVGFFPGFRMNFHTVNTVANRIWKQAGLESVMSTASGFWLFRFQREEQMQSVLERGPWMFGGKTMILQQWHPQFIFDKNRISKLPVWVRIHGLPFSFWSRKGLSVVASMMGRPLSCDESTFCCTRLDYARVCVEIDVAQPFIKNFDLNNPLSAEPIHIEVEYEWTPARCEKCKVFGHACIDRREKETLEMGPQARKDLNPATTTQEKGRSQQTGHTQTLDTTNHHTLKVLMQGITDVRPVGHAEKTLEMLNNSKGGGTSSNLHWKPSAVHESLTEASESSRAAKGKQKEVEITMFTVNDSLQSQDTLDEEESSATTAMDEDRGEGRDTSPMEFIKVRKRKGGKKGKGAGR